MTAFIPCLVLFAASPTCSAKSAILFSVLAKLSDPNPEFKLTVLPTVFPRLFKLFANPAPLLFKLEVKLSNALFTPVFKFQPSVPKLLSPEAKLFTLFIELPTVPSLFPTLFNPFPKSLPNPVPNWLNPVPN